MLREQMKQRLWCSALVLMLCSTHVGAQSARPDFTGMWSDPPPTPVDQFCFITCTDAGVAHLNALLDDPANDSRPFRELSMQAKRYEREEYVRPRLTVVAANTFPLDPADDPGFLQCEAWGFAREIFAPHQMEMRQYDDRIEIRYAEWDARRTIYMDGRRRSENQPASPMGYSVGRYEGSTLIVETSAVTANLAGIFPTFFMHGDQLRTIERYTRSAGRDRLEMTVTMEDPLSLRQPLQFRKAWGWAPQEEIFPYTDCEPPTEFRRRVNQP